MKGPADHGDHELTAGQHAREQHLHVAGGKGYAVTGANLYVWGDDAVPYLLENWHDAPAADPDSHGEQPGRLLPARHEVAGCTGRTAELYQLRQWRDGDARLAVRWLHGPPGAGKTSLAAAFANESAAGNWKVTAARLNPGQEVPVPASQNLAQGGAGRILLIVDNVDQWPGSTLASLLSDRQFRRPAGSSTRTRILMISRTRDRWPGIRHALAREQPGTSSQLLEPPQDGPGCL
jgi:ATPase family associated with various cellular activities (AAA)